jgi:hypothetical protein
MRRRRSRKVAASCTACGHIQQGRDSDDRCSACGASPAHWDTAPIEAQPSDRLAPAVGMSVGAYDDQAAPDLPDPASLFAVAAPGQEHVDVNPELRVRY